MNTKMDEAARMDTNHSGVLTDDDLPQFQVTRGRKPRTS